MDAAASDDGEHRSGPDPGAEPDGDSSDADETELRLGAWARSQGMTGLVAALADGEITLFDPAERRMAKVPASEVEAAPAGAVTVAVTVDVPLAHGVDEAAVRRWVATLTDEVLRERARSALAEAGLDEGAALPSARIDVAAMTTSGAVCLCGARVPAPPGSTLPCPSCGRQAIAPPPAGSA
jgi:hypothetical protein